MFPTVADIKSSAVFTLIDRFQNSPKGQQSFWATFSSKLVAMNFQKLPNLVTLEATSLWSKLDVCQQRDWIWINFVVISVTLLLGASAKSKNTNLKGSIAVWLTCLFSFIMLQDFVELATFFLFWSNLNQSKWRSAIQWYFPSS